MGNLRIIGCWVGLGWVGLSWEDDELGGQYAAAANSGRRETEPGSE